MRVPSYHFFLLVTLLGFAEMAAAQQLTTSQERAIAGSTGGLHLPTQPPPLNGAQNTGTKVHLRPNGKPCLTVSGAATRQTINTHIFTHWINVANECSMPIKLRVCYYETEECTQINVPAYGRKESVLGIMPAMDQFRFEYREQFGGMDAIGLGLQ